MKKLLALLLALFLIPTIQVSAAKMDGATDEVLPAVDGIENYFKNGDFEETTGDQADGWTAGRGEWGGMASVVKDADDAPSGKNYVMIDGAKCTSSLGSPFITQSLKTVGRALYQFEMYVKTEPGASSAVKLEFYPDLSIPGAGTCGEVNPYQNFQGDGTWEHVILNFRAPLTALDGKILLRIYNKGIVYYDKVSVRMVEAPPMATLSADNVFVYSDWTRDVTVDMAFTPAKYFPVLNEGVTVDFSLVDDDDNVITSQKGLKTNGESLSYKVNPAHLKEKKKEYTVQADIKDKKGKIVYTATTPLYKYDRPALFGADGVYREEDGTVFYPNVGYHAFGSDAQMDEVLEYCVKAGINVLQCNASDLDALLESGTGVKGFVTLYGNMQPAGHESNAERTKATVEKYKDHPALFCWGIMDEPFLNLSDPEDDLRESYKIIRDIDDKHPVYICECMQSFHRTSVKYVDIMAIDPYPTTGMALTVYNRYADAEIAANNTGRQVMAVNMAYRQGDYMPSGQDVRHINYQTLMGGCAMFGYYSLSDAVVVTEDGKRKELALWDEHEKVTDCWQGMVDFEETEAPILLEHFYEKKTAPFSHEMNEIFGYHGIGKDGSLYMMVMNNTPSPREITVPLKSFDGSMTVSIANVERVSKTGAEPTVDRGASELKVKLSGWEPVLYKITPQMTTSFDSLTWAAYETYLNAPKAYFKDLGDYAWAAEQVERLYRENIVNTKGEGIYAPGAKITRGDFAMFFIRTLGLTANTSDNFADVASDAAYAKELAIGKALGIFNGVGDNQFAPESEITRQDLMTIIARGMNLTGEGTDLAAFPDAGSVASYALDAVCAMVKSGLVKGNADGTLNPLGNTTRAEAAVIMVRILDQK